MYTFIAETYDGTIYNSNSHMFRRGVQIVCTDETGKRRAIFKTARGKSPCYKMGEWACHYKTGLNKHDAQSFAKTLAEAKRLARKWHAAGAVDPRDL